MANGQCSLPGCNCQSGAREVSRDGKQYCSERCANAEASGSSGAADAVIPSVGKSPVPVRQATDHPAGPNAARSPALIGA